jgi:hypothetical protein
MRVIKNPGFSMLKANRPLSLQLLPDELFFVNLKPYYFGDPYLVFNGIGGTNTPVLIQPFICESIRGSYGLYRGYGITTLYVFDNPKPRKSDQIIYELTGGKWDGYFYEDKRRYHNILEEKAISGPINLTKKHSLILEMVLNEMNNLLYTSGKYLLEETIDRSHVVKIGFFKENDFEKTIYYTGK